MSSVAKLLVGQIAPIKVALGNNEHTKNGISLDFIETLHMAAM